MKCKEVSIIEIKVLGPGCPNCHKLEETVKDAVKELGMKVKIEKVNWGLSEEIRKKEMFNLNRRVEL